MSWLLRPLASRNPASEIPSRPSVSVCIPSLNGGERLVELVRAVLAQADSLPPGGLEVLVADSGSRDEGFAEVRSLGGPVRCFAVAPRRFNHGLVRNELAQEAAAPLLAFFSQDAVPRPQCLATLLNALDNPSVAGAYARQLPRPGADALVRATLARWTPDGNEVRLQALGEANWEGLSPTQKMHLSRFDNVASMLRANLLAHTPFAEVEFGEDIAWGAAMVQSGHALAYVPSATVEHSHALDLKETLKRHRLAHIQARRDFGLRAVPSLGALGRALAEGLPGDLRDGGALGALRGLPIRAAALTGQWLGGREGER
jgi:rhamnosyltransferase